MVWSRYILKLEIQNILLIEKHTGDAVRDMYSVLLEISLEIGEMMRLTLEQERKDGET